MIEKLYLRPLSRSNTEGVRYNIWLPLIAIEKDDKINFVDNNVKRYKLLDCSSDWMAV